MKITLRPDLKSMSTLRLGGTADAAYHVQDYNDLEVLGKKWPELGPRVLVMGRGSNILFQENLKDLSIVLWGKKDDPVILNESGEKIKVMVDAGMSMPGLLRWCSARGLTGLENLAGIPGRVGGAVVMNAGSYGAETADALNRLTVWTPDSGIMEIDSAGFQAGYRSLDFTDIAGPFIIIKAGFILGKDDPARVKSRIRSYYNQKKNTQPVLEKTAGCIFKNPPDSHPAGFLLEKAGFRGKGRGGVIFSDKHSNFLVNKDRGSSQAALELISEAREKILEMFGISLEMEVEVV